MSGVYDMDQLFGCWNRNISAEVCQCHGYWRPGPRFNMKMTSYQYRKSHCVDKTILRPSYLHNGISYTSYVVMEFIGSFSFQGRISTIYVTLSCWKMEENENMFVWFVKKNNKKKTRRRDCHVRQQESFLEVQIITRQIKIMQNNPKTTLGIHKLPRSHLSHLHRTPQTTLGISVKQSWPGYLHNTTKQSLMYIYTIICIPKWWS